MHVVLVEPEIPPNTGNIARTCAATRTQLHLVEPLGFSLEDRYLRRAGVDYWHLVDLRVHPSWEHVVESLTNVGAFHFFTSHGGTRYTDVSYHANDVLVFGRESTGLPEAILDRYREAWRVIPMAAGVRSLNLSNAVAIAVYEAQRQLKYQPLG
ncbi:tRNA (uridine(34)/cytosine(34)/5-carboxymethylaminomethyluridine(34)-2'-O)-methyltransferase TrmL [Sulfobacillus harzensis]|uniref:Putative tRNA (cytidine(34)-2'-O)-methyltransferase n=1 Tax=Sulfobacillus harzensis TaxID=2729629 RepID=A0A7Y0L249_9FIRM|nr:tRNA (uridine(34)/cytosine(34)/5-carboxymethylaminomethyluridine(34)-2'-O)-methyltransferase TrmL [Sulfobacillus harzensis]NMP21658.1 tRNA (uridine(34)/cytosine(34)/5-carboxymethylaminomethyluridine(34)-2'-O)-methyltransferase TrmL [Sulfobacillus harzensis]